MGTQAAVTYSNWSSSIADTITTDAQGNWVTESELSDTKAYSYNAPEWLTAVADDVSGTCTTRCGARLLEFCC
jgi:hypothetical protein